jgi:hypothetical protein
MHITAKNQIAMMKKAKQFLFLAACAMLLSGCSLLTTDEKSNEPISGIPFQEDEDGEWGMMSPSGEIIFVPQLESQPHRAYCDRFFMKEEDGLYSLYAAETIPYKVNGGYLGVNHFIKDRAVVVKPGEPVIIIDKDGNTVKTLDTVDGKDVLRVKVAETDECVWRPKTMPGVCSMPTAPCSCHPDTAVCGMTTGWCLAIR